MDDTSTVPDPKRILVLGATGMAGHMVATYLQEAGHTVVGAARSTVPGIETAALDVLNFSALAEFVSSGEFDVVVNCVGMLVAGSEKTPAQAVLINAYLPHMLADLLSSTDTKLIHLSTDCVFEGDGAPYEEGTRRDGQSFYDRSKGLGEIENDKDLTLRMSIIGPEVRPDGTGLMHWFLGESGTLNGYVGARWNGITTLELAKAIHQLLDQPLTGIYHLVPNYSTSKFDLLNDIKTSFGRSDLNVAPEASVTIDKTLLDTRQELGFVVGPSGYPAMLDELRDWIDSHPGLYESHARYATHFPDQSTTGAST